MEKIYIAELIKDCPKGTKLYTTVWGDVEFIEYNSSLHLIKVSVPDSVVNQKLLYGDGSYTITGECILFPSKENRDWSKFQIFKDGDILTYMFYNKPTIYIYRKNGGYNTSYYVAYSSENEKFYNIPTGALAENRNDVRFANEEEKQKLFDVIKANGYEWNPETKTLEKLEVSKFDITTLKPFESRVLVRDYNTHIWEPVFWGKLLDEKNPNLRYLTTNGCFKYCIPYENNQHLLGTTNDCDEYYKTWE